VDGEFYLIVKQERYRVEQLIRNWEAETGNSTPVALSHSNKFNHGGGIKKNSGSKLHINGNN
jgi:hypothetical protein